MLNDGFDVFFLGHAVGFLSFVFDYPTTGFSVFQPY